MEFDLEARRARLSVGELADFDLGPREGSDGPSGLWRAQLGSAWHAELRARESAARPGAEFEVRIESALEWRGWTLALEGRIDQLSTSGDAVTLREIKTVTRGLPEDEAVLRADYPAYFLQLAAYAEMWRQNFEQKTGRAPSVAAELVFVEVSGGLIQTVEFREEDRARWRARLDRVAGFLDDQARARDRRHSLRLQPPFAVLRPGQAEARAGLSAALAQGDAAVLFDAPTGFGKTGIMLACALEALRAGTFDRILYLTGKSTGQIQVGHTLRAALDVERSGGLVAWTVRPKTEHCVNHVFQCTRQSCAYLEGASERWDKSGLARLYLDPAEPRDLPALRAAGRAARICPYEITRSAIPFSDICLADYNYVFSPSVRGLFYDQPGFSPARALLLVDEAHNLPGRVAGVYSAEFSAAEAERVGPALEDAQAPSDLRLAWEAWTEFLRDLAPIAPLPSQAEDEARIHLDRITDLLRNRPLDYEALAAGAAEILWQLPSAAGQLDAVDLPRLWWCARPGQLSITCLDAAAAIGAGLAEFGGVVLATATPAPPDILTEAFGLARAPRAVAADAAWRQGAYDVACDLRVDTRFRVRARHQATTADTIARMCLAAEAAGDALGAPGRATSPDQAEKGVSAAEAAPRLRTAAFFPSYAYAEAIAREMAERHQAVRVALQARLGDLAAQTAWIERSFGEADVLFLILGSSYAESIDLLGGRVTHAVVVGPALPEVNPVQKARMESLADRGQEAAFRRVYALPGMQKVNQALGRLVRGPGQRAKVLLHCRRFADREYADLLVPDYRNPFPIRSDGGLEDWLQR